MDLIEKREVVLNAVNELSLLLNDKDVYFKMQSDIDKEIADYLHLLEIENLSSSEISKVTKNLRRALSERRNIKGIVAVLTNCANGCTVPNFIKSSNKNLRDPKEIKNDIKLDYLSLLNTVLSK